MAPLFKPGNNIAIKVPSHEYDTTVHFYRTILGLTERRIDTLDTLTSVAFEFGDKLLWIDQVTGISQAEVWLEIETDDVAAAKHHLHAHGCVFRDDIEALPADFTGFWLNSPSNIIHLVSEHKG